MEEQRASEPLAAPVPPAGEEEGRLDPRRRRELELARVDVARRLQATQAERYRAMLQSTLDAIDAELNS